MVIALIDISEKTHHLMHQRRLKVSLVIVAELTCPTSLFLQRIKNVLRIHKSLKLFRKMRISSTSSAYLEEKTSGKEKDN